MTKKITALLLALMLGLMLTGCDFGLDDIYDPNELGEEITNGQDAPTEAAENGEEDASGNAIVKGKEFALTRDDFLAQLEKHPALTVEDKKVLSQTPRSTQADETGSVTRHRYRTEERLALSIFEDEKSKNILQVQIQAPSYRGQADQVDYSDTLYHYTQAVADILGDLPEEHLAKEIAQSYVETYHIAQRNDYGQQTIQYENMLIVFKNDVDRNTSATFSAVTDYENWRSFSYYDGKEYHIFADEEGVPHAATEDDLVALAKDYLAEGDALPSQLEKDLPLDFFTVYAPDYFQQSDTPEDTPASVPEEEEQVDTDSPIVPA